MHQKHLHLHNVLELKTPDLLCVMCRTFTLFALTKVTHTQDMLALLYVPENLSFDNSRVKEKFRAYDIELIIFRQPLETPIYT